MLLVSSTRIFNPHVAYADLDDFVSCWDMDETSGARNDESLNANNLSNSGAGSATGKISNAVDFNLPDGDYLSIADASQSGLDITGDLSMAVWINLDSEPGDTIYNTMVIAGKWGQSSGQRSYQFGLYDPSGTKNLNFEPSNNGSSNARHLTPWTWSTGTWYHVGFAYDASVPEVQFYVNGSAQGSAVSTGAYTSLHSGSATFEVGQQNGSVNHFDGQMDVLEIYDRELSSSEFADLYASGAGIACDDPSRGSAPEPDPPLTPATIMTGRGAFSGNSTIK